LLYERNNAISNADQQRHFKCGPTTPFQMRTNNAISNADQQRHFKCGPLAQSMDEALHFDHITPCSEKWTANFAKILAAVVSMPAGR